MSIDAPSFTLIAEPRTSAQQPGWRFSLQTDGGKEFISAEDCEHGLSHERLELLAVIRGLEALEQPSRVSILTPSQYVRRGLAYGLEEWRSNGWTWEHFGQMVLVKNHDLWQRLDRALAIHQVECRRWRFDAAHQHKTATTAHRGCEGRQPTTRRRAWLDSVANWLFHEPKAASA